MKNIKNVILLLITVFMCFSVACTGEPAEEEKPQIKYNDFISQQTTTITQTRTKHTKSKKSTKINSKKKSKKSVNNVVSKENNSKKVTTKINNGVNNTNKVIVVNSKTTVKTTIVTTTITELQETATTTLAPLLDTDICYVTASGEKYHRQGCRYLKRSCLEMLVGEAKEKKYTPCKVCKP